MTLTDDGTTWGGAGNANTLTIDSWSDTAITFTVPTPSGSGDSVHVDPGSDAAVTVVSAGGNSSDTADLQITPTSNPADYYDNMGISPDDNQACANFDGVGFSYSANALAQQGLSPGATVNADGLSFTWPNVQPCSMDNILAAGQTMLVQGTSGAKTLGLLGASTNGGSQGTVTINYTDGTSTTQPVSFNDWASSPSSPRHGRGHDVVPQLDRRHVADDHDVRVRDDGAGRPVEDGRVGHPARREQHGRERHDRDAHIRAEPRLTLTPRGALLAQRPPNMGQTPHDARLLRP